MEQGACVGLYFINRPEWLVVDHACAAYSFISVPLYDTLGTSSYNFLEFERNCIFLNMIFRVTQDQTLLSLL